MNWNFRLPMAGFLFFALFGCALAEDSYQKWSLSKAVKILNSSAWARHETFTRVVGGVGSGVSGEKEIYNTFYIRFLSAQPIRDAFTRIQQLQRGYDDLTEEQQQRLDLRLQPILELDVDRWIVVAVSFRSNDPNEESRVRQFFESQTTQTLKNRAFLSTDKVPQIPLSAYFAPAEEGVGGKFVFPRQVNGEDLVGRKTRRVTFELLQAPGADSTNTVGERGSGRGRGGRGDRGGRGGGRDAEGSYGTTGSDLRSIFFVEDMVIAGEVVL